MNEEKDFEIEFLGAERASHPGLEVPKNAVQVGEIMPGDVQVYLGQEVLRQLDALSCYDVRKEVGSFLVGDYTYQEGRLCAIVTGFIEAKYSDASSASLTFTHKTWSYVDSQLSERFAGLRILGWQHTHPGYGVFLSEHDLFIQENFFNLPYQIAYVVDPIRGHKGFFQWRQGRVCPLSGYYVFGNMGEKIQLEMGVQAAGPKRQRRKWLIWLLVVLALLAGGTVFFTVLSGRKNKVAPSPGNRPGVVELRGEKAHPVHPPWQKS